MFLAACADKGVFLIPINIYNYIWLVIDLLHHVVHFDETPEIHEGLGPSSIKAILSAICG